MPTDQVARALLNLTPEGVARAASGIMDRAQHMRPEEAAAGIAASLVLICHAAQVSVHKSLEVAERALRDAEHQVNGSNRIGAIRDLLAKEMRL